MQAIGRNKFVAPSIAGTTQAAALGILLTSLLIQEHQYGVNFYFHLAYRC